MTLFEGVVNVCRSSISIYLESLPKRALHNFVWWSPCIMIILNVWRFLPQLWQWYTQYMFPIILRFCPGGIIHMIITLYQSHHYDDINIRHFWPQLTSTFSDIPPKGIAPGKVSCGGRCKMFTPVDRPICLGVFIIMIIVATVIVIIIFAIITFVIILIIILVMVIIIVIMQDLRCRPNCRWVGVPQLVGLRNANPLAAGSQIGTLSTQLVGLKNARKRRSGGTMCSAQSAKESEARAQYWASGTSGATMCWAQFRVGGSLARSLSLV